VSVPKGIADEIIGAPDVAKLPMAETLPPIAATEQADGLLSDPKGLAVHAAGPIVGRRIIQEPTLQDTLMKLGFVGTGALTSAIVTGLKMRRR
jgi:hypothetical protein